LSQLIFSPPFFSLSLSLPPPLSLSPLALGTRSPSWQVNQRDKVIATLLMERLQAAGTITKQDFSSLPFNLLK
jgi:hypothetical protein